MGAANVLLGALPDQRRIQRLMPAQHRCFEVLEQHPYGSTLHLAPHGIAHNFLAEDPGTTQVLRQCLAAEERAPSRLGHDFTYAVCAPLAAPRPG
jgi:hypothetical protein